MSDEDGESRTIRQYLNLADPQSRDNSLLTASLRKFLCNQGDYDDSSRSTYRHRIRERVRNGLRDLDYMRAVVDPDVELIFDGMDSPEERYDVIQQALGFLYRGARISGDIDFEAALETAIRNHEHHMSMAEGYRVEDVHVQININRTQVHVPDFEEAKEKLEAGDPLRDEEVKLLLQELPEDEVDEVVEYVRSGGFAPEQIDE